MASDKEAMTKPIVFWLQLFSLVTGVGLVAMAIQIEQPSADAETPVYAPKRGPASANAGGSTVERSIQSAPSTKTPLTKLQHTDPLKQTSVIEEKSGGVVRPYGSVGNQNLPEQMPGSRRGIFAP